MTAPTADSTDVDSTDPPVAESAVAPEPTVGEPATAVTPGSPPPGSPPPGSPPPVSSGESPGAKPSRWGLNRLAGRRLFPWTPTRIGTVAAVWLVTTLLLAGVVSYGFGPLIESRHQRASLAELRGDMSRAVGATQSLFGDQAGPTRAPELGDPVAILQIPRLELQQVIVEGADSKRTQTGPGHVPGTAGPGQPGNSAVVARRYGFGGPFRQLATLRSGDDIIISTTQGQSLYKVESVIDGADLGNGEDIYAATDDDRLTLVTSGSAMPWESDHAVVVVAKMSGLAYPATPQGGRARVQDGRFGDPSAIALIMLYGALFAGIVVAAVLLYRRWLSMSTYVMTAPVMVALIVLGTEAATRLLPGWT